MALVINILEPNAEHSKSTDNHAVKIVEPSHCELCDYSSTSITSLNRHMVKRHNSIPQFDGFGSQSFGKSQIHTEHRNCNFQV